MTAISRVLDRSLLVALLLLSIAAYTPCNAQAVVPDLSQASLEQLGNIKVYSASKHLQPAAEAPSSVTVITASDIQKHGYRTLADVLRTVSGFYVSTDRNYSYLGFRGFGRPGDYNTRVLLLVDGHRTNDNIYDQAMLGTEFPVDVDMIERVEVIPGPGSSLYGSNAFLATINVITRKAHDLNGWELSFEPGSFATYKGRVSYGGIFKGADLAVSGSFYDSGGQNLFFPEFNSLATHNGVAQNLDYDHYGDFLVTTSFRDFTLQGTADWREKGIPTAPFDTVFDDPRTHSVDQHQYVDLGDKWTMGPWRVGIRTYWDRYAYDGWWPFAANLLNVDYARGQRWGSELQLNRALLRKHYLTAGTEFRDNFQQDQRNYDATQVLVDYVNSHRSCWSYAAFVQDEYEVTRKFKVNAGVRYDGITGYDGSTSPRIGLIYRAWPKTSFKLLYGSAFRTPTVFERFYGAAVASNSQYLTNSRLHSESIKNIEAVWEQHLGDNWEFSTDLFRNYITDLISLQQESDSNTGLLIYRNSDKAQSTGASLELKGHWLHRLETRLNYTLVQTEDQKTNQTVVNSPRHLGNLVVSSLVFRKSLFASLDAQYEGARRTLSGGSVPAFPVLNATLFGYAFDRHADISASVYNLFDRTYYDVAPAEDRLNVLRQDGRSLRLNLTWHFGGKR